MSNDDLASLKWMDFHCEECERWVQLMEELNLRIIRETAPPVVFIKTEPNSIALARQQIAQFYEDLGIPMPHPEEP